MTHTSANIITIIRDRSITGGFSVTAEGAVLLLDLYVSAMLSATRAERDMLADAASALSDRTQRVIIVGDHSPEVGARQ